MKSHTYNFASRELLKWIAAPLIPVIIAAVAIHSLARVNLLPRPLPILDMDRTILLHQAQAAVQNTNPNLILIGDSSCLVDADARDLERLRGGSLKVLNLGTLSYLNLDGYALLLQKHFEQQPNASATVLLLMHPQALRLANDNPYYIDTLNDYFDGKDSCELNVSRLDCAAGLNVIRGRLVSRVLPASLPRKQGEVFGFNKDLWNFLSAHNGSGLDPNRYDANAEQGNAEFRLSKSVEEASKRFRAALPKNVKLITGITPCPESFVTAKHAETIARILQQWSAALQTDRTLSLPPTMPDQYFASPTHLNVEGQALFTRRLNALITAAN
jgi:hypothetical protein